MRSEKYANQRKESRKRWFFRILSIILVVGSLAVGTLLGYYGSRINNLLTNISADTPEDLIDTTEQDIELANLRPFSVLILGLDELEEVQRTDSIMVATINPDEDSVKLLSIPRDTLITMPSGQLDKVNAMHAYGGVSQTIETVENYLEIPISFYATLDFQGLIKLVDAVGGVEVEADFSFTVQDENENMGAIQIEEGLQTLDGQHALGYARMRKQDPRGDWGRQERQREIIQSLASELLSVNLLTNFDAIIDAIQPYLGTNMRGNQMLTIANGYRSTANNIETLELLGAESYIYFPHYGQEVYVWEPFPESLIEVKQELHDHLELDFMNQNDDLLDEDFQASDFEEVNEQ